jgi:hypothetical protein
LTKAESHKNKESTKTVYLLMMEVAAMAGKSVVILEVKRKLAMAIKNTQELIENCEQSRQLRLKESAFTRERKLGARKILGVILHGIYHSLQLCVDKYFDDIDESPVSKQAFSKARKQLNPEYVRSFVDMTSKIASEDEAKSTYNGMTLIAVDGSGIALENTPELKEAFGCSGPKNSAATGLCSIALIL